MPILATPPLSGAVLTPAAGKIPLADGFGKINGLWLPTALYSTASVAVAGPTAVPSSLNVSTEGLIDWLLLNASTSNPPNSFTHRKRGGEWDMQNSFAWYGSNSVGMSNFTSTSTMTMTTTQTDEAYWGVGAYSSAVDVGVFPTSLVTGFGFNFRARATTTPRTLKVYCGVFKGVGTLSATLSDGTTNSASLTSPSGASAENYAYFSVTYNSSTPGQFLNVKFDLGTNNGTAGQANVKFLCATLA